MRERSSEVGSPHRLIFSFDPMPQFLLRGRPIRAPPSFVFASERLRQHWLADRSHRDRRDEVPRRNRWPSPIGLPSGALGTSGALNLVGCSPFLHPPWGWVFVSGWKRPDSLFSTSCIEFSLWQCFGLMRVPRLRSGRRNGAVVSS